MNESPIGAVLKTMRKRKEKREIRVCNECGVPLIWTFAFPYCERFCLNCGATGGMLGTGIDIPTTRELIFQKRLVDAIWKVIYSHKGLLPNGRFGRSGCKKDNGSCNDHRAHLSKTEIEWDEIARKYLERFEGVIKIYDKV